MSLESELNNELKSHGADFVYHVDISRLSKKPNKGYPNALLFGTALLRAYIQQICQAPDYVQKMIENQKIELDDFHVKAKNGPAGRLFGQLSRIERLFRLS
jgi:hypothetical protein